jgi:hypothetical protein
MKLKRSKLIEHDFIHKISGCYWHVLRKYKTFYIDIDTNYWRETLKWKENITLSKARMNFLLCKTGHSDTENQKFAATDGTVKYSCFSQYLKAHIYK